MRSHTDNDFIGSANEIVQIIDDNWNQRKLNELQRLGSELDCNLIESLPTDILERLMGETSHQPKYDNDILELKRYTSTNSDGARYEIACPSRLYRKVKKFDKKLHEECREFVFSISDVPNGSSLPRSHNSNYYGKFDDKSKRSLRREYQVPYEYDSYKYRIGNYRILWYNIDDQKCSYIFEMSHQSTVHKKLYPTKMKRR